MASAVGVASLGLRRPPAAFANAEWDIDLVSGWKISKKLDSVVRIQALTVLAANNADLGLELSLRKVPLGATAASAFPPNDMLALATYFAANNAQDNNAPSSSTSPGTNMGAKDMEAIMRRSLEAQAQSLRTPLRAVYDAVGSGPEAYSRFSKGRVLPQRYLQYAYESDSCRQLDIDGGCEGRPERRRHLAVITVGLETQARTLAERQAMEDGEMEARQIDVLWLLTMSAPAVRWPTAEPAALAVARSFSVLSDSLL